MGSDLAGTWLICALFLSPIALIVGYETRKHVLARKKSLAYLGANPRKWLGRAVAVKLADPRDRVILASGHGDRLSRGFTTHGLALVTRDGTPVELDAGASIECAFLSAEIEWRPRRRQYVEFGEWDEVADDWLWARTDTPLSLLGIVDDAEPDGGAGAGGPYRDGHPPIRVRSIDGSYWLTDGTHAVEREPAPLRGPRWAVLGWLLVPNGVWSFVMAVAFELRIAVDLVWSIGIAGTVISTIWIALKLPRLALPGP